MAETRIDFSSERKFSAPRTKCRPLIGQSLTDPIFFASGAFTTLNGRALDRSQHQHKETIDFTQKFNSRSEIRLPNFQLRNVTNDLNIINDN